MSEGIPICPDCGHPWDRHKTSKVNRAGIINVDTGKPMPGHPTVVCNECIYGPQQPR
jgi:hypothetical protein